MDTIHYPQMVLFVKTDDNGRTSDFVEPKEPNDPDFDFGKKIIHIREGNSFIKLWLGALDRDMVINSIDASIKKHHLRHNVDMNDSDQNQVIWKLFHVCKINDIMFQTVVQIILDVKLRRISLVERMEDGNQATTEPVATPSGGRVSTDDIDMRFELRSGFLFIAIAGVCNELFTPANFQAFLEEMLCAIEDIDLRQSTNILSLVDTDNIAQGKAHQQIDRVDGTTVYTVYIPVFQHAQSAPWGCGLCYGPKRVLYPSERHGYNDRLSAAGGQPSTGNAAATTDEPEQRRKEYTFTLVNLVPQGYELAGEIRGATWMDAEVVLQQVGQWLATAGFPDAHVILRTCRLKNLKLSKEKKGGRWVAYPVITIYLPTAKRCVRFHILVGLSGRTPVSQTSSSTTTMDITWKLVARGPPIIIRDFIVVPLNLVIKQVLLGKNMNDLVNVKATAKLLRYGGVHMGPLSNRHINRLHNVLLGAVDLLFGLTPVCMYLTPSVTVQGNCNPGSCELIIVQNDLVPLPTEISQVTAAIEEFAYRPTIGITAVPFKGSYRNDPSVLKDTMGSFEADGSVLMLPQEFHLFRHLAWGQGVYMTNTPEPTNPDNSGDSPPSRKAQTSPPSSQSSKPGPQLVTASKQVGVNTKGVNTTTTSNMKQVGSTSKIVLNKELHAGLTPKDLGVLKFHQTNPSGGSGNSFPIRDITGDSVTGSHQLPPMDTDEVSVTDSANSGGMDEASDPSDDEDFINGLNAATNTEPTSGVRATTRSDTRESPPLETTPPESDSPLKRLRSRSKTSSRGSSSVAPPGQPAQADRVNVG